MRTIAFVVVAALLLTLPAAAAVNRTDADFVGQPAPPINDGSDACPPGAMIVDPTPFIDGGNTCGNTNTLGSYSGTCGLPFPYNGEDQIYQVNLGGGNSVAFSADLTGSAGDLVLFLIGTCGDGTSCVDNSQDSIGPGVGPEDIPTASYTPGTYYLYVDSYYDAGTAGSCGTFTLTVSGTLPVELMDFSID